MSAPVWSLTVRGWELNRARRIVIYAAKIGQGAALSLTLVAPWFLFQRTLPALTLTVAWTLAVSLVLKIDGQIRHDYRWNPRDWLCDLALSAMWAAPWLPGWWKAAPVAVWLCTYAWSEE